MSNDVAVCEGSPPALTTVDIKKQVALIQDVMTSVMKKDEHYGVIPGCGDKPSLLQPGAQKLIMTFRLVPDPEVEVIDLYHTTIPGHREYRVKVKLYTQNGIFLGAGVGSCSTMEGKFRYRKADIKCPDCGKAAIIKGKTEFGGGWVCYGKKGGCGKKWTDADNPFESVMTDKAEHDNPADYYNTCEKMAYKRALVSATLTVTAASDIFTQDVEDMPEVFDKDKGKTGSAQKPLKEPQKKSADGKEKTETETQKHTGTLIEISSKSGKKGSKEWTLYGVKVDNLWFNTFDKTIAESAKEAEGRQVEVEYVQTDKSKDLKGITLLQEETVDCPGDPMNCEKSTFDAEGNVECSDTQQPCPYKKEG